MSYYLFDDSAYANRPGVVYLFWAVDSDRFKIGCSTVSAESRRDEINKHQPPFRVQIVLVISVPNATLSEAKLHALFKSRKKCGEYFQFSADEIESYVIPAYIQEMNEVGGEMLFMSDFLQSTPVSSAYPNVSYAPRPAIYQRATTQYIMLNSYPIQKQNSPLQKLMDIRLFPGVQISDVVLCLLGLFLLVNLL